MNNEVESNTNTRAWKALPWNDTVALCIMRVDTRQQKIFVLGETTRKEGYGECEQLPAVLTKTQAQVLMDDLWHCGLRPSEGSGSAGQLASVQKHLEDLRTFAFHKLGIQDKKI